MFLIHQEEEEEAYAADTDYETDEEKPLATAPIIPVVYSSEEECETAARYKIASKFWRIAVNLYTTYNYFLKKLKSCCLPG